MQPFVVLGRKRGLLSPGTVTHWLTVFHYKKKWKFIKRHGGPKCAQKAVTEGVTFIRSKTFCVI